MASSTCTWTPPRESTTLDRPEKSTTTKSSIRTCVSFSTVLRVQAAPEATAFLSSLLLPAPLAKAELNGASSLASVFPPSRVVHSGMSTRVSRGMDTASTRERSAEMCMTSAVSERATETSSSPCEPSTLLFPARESVPRIRRLTARPS